MTPPGTVTLTTPRLVLRPFTLEDAEAMYHTWAKDPEVTRWMRWQPHKSIDETSAVLADWVKSYRSGDTYLWAITLKDSHQLMGSLGIFNGEDSRFPGHKQPAYCIGKAYWGKGYTAEALTAALKHFIAATGCTSLYCSHAVGNPASGRVMEKAGFVYHCEGSYLTFSGQAVPARQYLYQPPQP